MRKDLRKKKPKKTERYTKSINVGFTVEQWTEINNWANRANLEPSVYIRKILLDFLSIGPTSH